VATARVMTAMAREREEATMAMVTARERVRALMATVMAMTVRAVTVREMMTRAMTTMDGKGNGNGGNSEQVIKQAATVQQADARQLVYPWHSSISVACNCGHASG